MAGNARKNGARNQTGGGNAPWFEANKVRQRARAKAAKASRKKNRCRK